MTNTPNDSVSPQGHKQEPYGSNGAKCYPLTPELAKELRQAKPALTASEWQLWSLLVTLDLEHYPTAASLQKAVKQGCNLKNSTYFAAVRKLRKRGLLPEWFPFNPPGEEVSNG
jgi:hypothetical protein